MAKRNLTVLFGADTSKLTKALGGLRKKISGAFSGMLSLKGMAAAGIGGFGISQAVGLLMNLSPAFANALLKMKEPLMAVAAKVADTIAPALASFADFLTSTDMVSAISEWWQGMQDGFGIVVDFLGGVPGMLKDGFLFITGALSDIYEASLILLKQFDQMVSDALGTAVASGLSTDTGMNAFGAAVDAARNGEGGLGQLKAAGMSLIGGFLGQTVRGAAVDSLGATDR
jgi:hypothetical protein